MQKKKNNTQKNQTFKIDLVPHTRSHCKITKHNKYLEELNPNGNMPTKTAIEPLIPTQEQQWATETNKTTQNSKQHSAPAIFSAMISSCNGSENQTNLQAQLTAINGRQKGA